MLFSVEQAFVGREEIRAPLKTPAWEAILERARKNIICISNANKARTSPGLFKAYVSLVSNEIGFLVGCFWFYNQVRHSQTLMWAVL